MKNFVQVLSTTTALALATIMTLSIATTASAQDFGPGGRGPGGGFPGGGPGGAPNGGMQRPGGPGNGGGGFPGGGHQGPGGGQFPGGNGPGPQPGPRPGPGPGGPGGPGFPHPGPRPGPGGPGPGPGWPHPGPGPGPRPGPVWPAPRPVPPPMPPPPPPPQQGYFNVYRFVGGFDHLLTLDSNEGYNAGYQFEGVAFTSFAGPFGGSSPRTQLFRCSAFGDHFASQDPNCEGQNREGSLGWLNVNPGYDGSRMIVRCFNGRNHLVTADANECYNAGYRVEFQLGYAL